MEAKKKFSSKPKKEPSLENSIRKHITKEMCFKKDGKALDVLDIVSKHVRTTEPGEYLDENKNKWNCKYSGYVTLRIKPIQISASNELAYLEENFKMYGHINREENEIKEIYKIVNVAF